MCLGRKKEGVTLHTQTANVDMKIPCIYLYIKNKDTGGNKEDFLAASLPRDGEIIVLEGGGLILEISFTCEALNTF